jgi:penicillin-binding protein-related factor A (putative recombinase)
MILTKRSSSGKKVAPIVIQTITMQEQNAVIKALDFYYKDRSKLDFCLMLIDIYILFN